MIKSAVFSLCILWLFCGKLMGADIYCHAAASLTEVLTEVSQTFNLHGTEKVLFNFGASSLLARQIEEGAPADLFFSANEEKMDLLEKTELIVQGTRISLLSNTLVIVTPHDETIELKSAKDLRSVKGRIAIAEYQSVPAGIYAREYLSKIGVWNELLDRLIPVQNVRAALAAVESGNAKAGIVYKTDANISKRVRVVLEIPLDEGPRISYSLAILKHSKNFAGAKRFYDYLLSADTLKIFQKYGFLIHSSFYPSGASDDGVKGL